MSNSAKSKNFRRRGGDDDGSLSPAPSTTGRKPAPASSKPKKLLSFADDEEEEGEPAPKPRGSSKPPASSHILTSSKGRAPPTLAFPTSNVQSPAGTYTKETLLELQMNMLKVVKPSSSAGGSVLLKLAEDEEEDDSRGIPDEETIKKIRARKEWTRQAKGLAPEPDYIFLEGGSVLGKASGDDDDDEEEEEEEKEKGVAPVCDVAVDGSRKSGLGSITDEFSAGHVEINGIDEDEDEEERLWEEEQFRKGLGRRMDDALGVNQVHGGNVHHQYRPQMQKRPVAYGPGANIGDAFGGYNAPESLSIPQQGEIAMKALQNSIQRLRESHGRAMQSLNRTDDNLSSSSTNITALEKSMSAAGDKFTFMQKLRQFVSVLCEFLQHKAPFIEELEEEMQKLRKKRVSAVVERRSADDNDEILEVEAAVEAEKLALCEHGTSADVIDAATSAAQAAMAAIKKQVDLPVNLDEFGRDVNQQKRMDVKRRADARHQRRTRKKFSSLDVGGMDIKVEGESSTDESDSESAAYESNHELLLQTADRIFSDAVEDYSELLLVKERFERWKKEYPASYRDAYVSLSTPAIFSPYLRLELLKWDPLHKNTDFLSMKWHSLLFDYGMLEGRNTLGSETGDADINLVPKLVKKVAIPILQHEIAHCWDIYSTRQTVNAVSAISLVINYIETSSEALEELLVAIRTRLADAVSALVVPTWSPLILNAVSSAGSAAAYRFGMSLRLFRSIGFWKGILEISVLEKLALDDVLRGKVLPHLQSISSNIHDAVTKTERVVASLSGVWAGPNIRGDHRKKLQPLVDFVMLLGRTLEKRHLSGASESEASGLTRRLKKMMVILDDCNKARQIANTLCVEEAL